MYIPASNFSEEQEQEIVCLITGESYVFLEGDEKSVIDPKLCNNCIDYLPSRFYKLPFIVRQSNGQMRVFGGID